MKFMMKKLFLLVYCISLSLMSDIQASSQQNDCNEKTAYYGAICLFTVGTCVLIYEAIPSLKKVPVYNESNRLLIVVSGGVEKMVGPGQHITLTHRFFPLKKICAKTKINGPMEKCTTEKAAAFNGIQAWYIDKDLVFTPDFTPKLQVTPHQVSVEEFDTRAMQYRSYEAEKKDIAYITLHKNNLRGSVGIDRK